MSNQMMVIAVVSQKGGGGKSTVSINLAAAAVENNKTTALIDIDQQASAAKWGDRRKLDNIVVIGALQSRIKQTLETARKHGADYVVIDSPGHNDTASVEAIRAADVVILPVEASMFHFDTLPAMRDLMRVAGDKPTWVLLNKLHPSAFVQAEKLKKMLAEAYSIPVCPLHLSLLSIYATSADIGLTPLEQEPEGKAAEEIRGLYKFTCQQVNKLRNKHVKNTKLATSA
jgi:chromosome partitioning protein